MLSMLAAAGCENEQPITEQHQHQHLSGRVIGITDGDTLTLLTERKRQVTIRLAEIDTPERGQPYGRRSKQALSDLAFGKPAHVDVIGQDRYGRTLGRVTVDDVDVNAELVRRGAAWVYRKYARDKTLFALEAEAAARQAGLWKLPETQRTPPWRWRQTTRSRARESAPAITALETNGEVACGSKRYCREMTDCAEARGFLQQCELTRLDGDADGLPCERLCRRRH